MYFLNFSLIYRLMYITFEMSTLSKIDVYDFVASIRFPQKVEHSISDFYFEIKNEKFHPKFQKKS